MIIETGNDYIAALKGNQPGLFQDVKTNFIPEFTVSQINKGHGRIEKRSVSVCQTINGIRFWPGLKTCKDSGHRKRDKTGERVNMTDICA